MGSSSTQLGGARPVVLSCALLLAVAGVAHFSPSRLAKREPPEVPIHPPPSKRPRLALRRARRPHPAALVPSGALDGPQDAIVSASDRDWIETHGLDPDVASVRSLAAFRYLFEEARFGATSRHDRELLFAIGRICDDLAGSPSWPEAVLYKVMCHELNGQFGHVAKGVKLVDLCRQGIAGTPSPSPETAAQLRYRLGIYYFLSQWFPFFRVPESPATARQEVAKAEFEQLSFAALEAIRTPSGEDMQRTVPVFLRALEEGREGSIPVVAAKIEAASEIFVGHGRPWSFKVLESVDDYLRTGAGADAYERYVSDRALPTAETAHLELSLAQMRLGRRSDYHSARQHAERGLVLLADVSEPRLRAQLLAVLAKCQFRAEEFAEARDTAEELLALGSPPLDISWPHRLHPRIEHILSTTVEREAATSASARN